MSHAARANTLLTLIAIFLLTLAPRAALSAGVTPLFDLKLDPPVVSISELNSSGALLAVRLGHGSNVPTGVVSIDKRGRLTSVEEFSSDETITVPSKRLAIAGLPPGDKSVRLPVVERRVSVSGNGETYTVAAMTKGAYYEVRHKDKDGRLLFMTAPRDSFGLTAVVVSFDGSRVLVADENPSGPLPGQRLYFYDAEGALLAEHDMGPDPLDWLNVSEGLMAKDGGYFVATRGKEGGESVVFFDSGGYIAWEKRFYKTHKLLEDLGGIFMVDGGSRTFLSYVTATGELRLIERAGYGFDLAVSEDKDRVCVLMFRSFDFVKSGLEERITQVFPKAKVTVVDVNALLPEGGIRPGAVVAPDGKAFIHTSLAPVSKGVWQASVGYYDMAKNELWRDRFFDTAVSALFTDQSRCFALTFGYPVARIRYYEMR